jgi:hypothetical protein
MYNPERVKEEAIELVDKFTIPYYQWDGDGYNIDWEETFKNRKQCALITVDKLIYYSQAHGLPVLTKFYEEVKTEIEKL